MVSSKEKSAEVKKLIAKEFVRYGARAMPLVPESAKVEQCNPSSFSDGNKSTYNQIRSQFKADLNARDTRFYISDLVANSLSVEDEEQRRFDVRVQDEVNRQVKVIKSEAHKEAYEKGLSEGKTKAFDEEKAALAQRIEALAETVNTLDSAKSQLAEQYEAELTKTCFKIAEAIVHYEIINRSNAVSACLMEILQKIAREDDVRIKLSASDFDAIDEIKNELQRSERQGRITFDVDHDLNRGDCVVESLSGEIASFVDIKISKLKELLDNYDNDKDRMASGDVA